MENNGAGDAVFMVGDHDTAAAFRIGGIESIVSNGDSIRKDMGLLIKREDAELILVTDDLAFQIKDVINDVNLNRVKPIIIEIPRLDDEQGFGKSILGYVTEALGISM